ncbi:MAG: adenylyltransferase/cytidyltransferase family protein [Thermoplasmata archaeon]
MADKKVMAVGVFDILHLGHVHYLKEAKKLGERLIVVVACDETVRKQKHEPLMKEDVRAEMVAALKPVDEVIVGHEEDKYRTVEEIGPDIIALGYDQIHEEGTIQKELKERGIRANVVRMQHYKDDLDGTRKIIRKIVDWYSMKKELEQVEGR